MYYRTLGVTYFLPAPLEKSMRTPTAVWIFYAFLSWAGTRMGSIYKIGVVIIMFKQQMHAWSIERKIPAIIELNAYGE